MKKKYTLRFSGAKTRSEQFTAFAAGIRLPVGKVSLATVQHDDGCRSRRTQSMRDCTCAEVHVLVEGA